MNKEWSFKNISNEKPICNKGKIAVQVLGSTLFILSNVIAGSSAHAACTGPDAEAGAWNYFSSENQFMYCDGTNWKVQTDGLLKKLPSDQQGVLFFASGTGFADCQAYGGSSNVVNIATDAESTENGVVCFDFIE